MTIGLIFHYSIYKKNDESVCDFVTLFMLVIANFYISPVLK